MKEAVFAAPAKMEDNNLNHFALPVAPACNDDKIPVYLYIHSSMHMHRVSHHPFIQAKHYNTQ